MVQAWPGDTLHARRAAGTPQWVTQRLALGYTKPQELLQPPGLATLGNYVFCTFYVFASTGGGPQRHTRWLGLCTRHMCADGSAALRRRVHHLPVRDLRVRPLPGP